MASPRFAATLFLCAVLCVFGGDALSPKEQALLKKTAAAVKNTYSSSTFKMERSITTDMKGSLLGFGYSFTSHSEGTESQVVRNNDDGSVDTLTTIVDSESTTGSPPTKYKIELLFLGGAAWAQLLEGKYGDEGTPALPAGWFKPGEEHADVGKDLEDTVEEARGDSDKNAVMEENLVSVEEVDSPAGQTCVKIVASRNFFRTEIGGEASGFEHDMAEALSGEQEFCIENDLLASVKSTATAAPFSSMLGFFPAHIESLKASGQKQFSAYNEPVEFPSPK